MKKLLLSLLVGLLFSLQAGANEISKYIRQTNFGHKASVGVYVLNISDDSVIYKKNESDCLNIASALKILTFGVAYKVLGKDYKFETSLYKDGENNAYIKLSGDVLFSYDDLVGLISNLKNSKINNIYVDDSIFDSDPYPKTWLDEDKWPEQGAITPYIIDANLTKVAISRSSLSKRVDVIQNDDYKIPFVNELKIGDKQDIKILRLYGENSPIINLQGTINQDEILVLPILNPELNFNIKIHSALEKNNIVYLNKITSKKTPQNAKKIASSAHNLTDVAPLILHNSQNFAAEVVFKVAAAKYINYAHSATFEDGFKMFYDIWANYLTPYDKIADASGVSRDNLFCPKTVAMIFRDLIKDEDFKKLLATSSEGTLCDRLLFLKDNLRAKTGTLRNFSSFLAVFSTRKNSDVILVSIVQDSKMRKSLLKNYENTLTGIIYKKY